jgi:cholesterol transport system auxiliary component
MSQLRLPLVSLCLALSGCSGLLRSNAPQLQLYVLQAPPALTVNAPTGPTLRIARPLPAAGLNTDRIALTRPGNRLDYYAGSRWSAPLSDVVSDLVLAAFRADPVWSAAADDRGTLNSDYLLQTSVDRFTAEYVTGTALPMIRVDLHCLLLRRSDGVLIGSFAVSQSQQAPANRMAGVVAAFSQVADQAVLAVAAQADQLLRSAKSPAVP